MKSAFPIVEVDGHKIISTQGNVGFFYKMIPPDLEQMTPAQIGSFYERLGQNLNNLESSAYFKFYRFKNESYLETNLAMAPEFSGVSLAEQVDPLKAFFGEDQLISDVGIYDDYLSYNGRYVRLVSAFEFSENEIDEYFIPSGVDYVLLVKKVETQKSISRLERIRSAHLASFTKAKRDLSSEGAYGQAENLLSDVLHGEEAIFEMELYFLLDAFDLKGLYQKTRRFQNQMLSIGLKVFVEGQSLRLKKTGLASLFTELIPGVKPSFSLRSHPNKTGHLRYLLPVNQSQLLKDGVKFHDVNNKEIYFNPFYKNFKNRNMLVSGMSGTGKSVFVNKLLHHLVDDHPAVILDMGGSYKRLALYHGGVELSSTFNPFHFKDPVYLREILLSVAGSKDFDNLAKGKLLFEIKRILTDCTNFFDLLNGLEAEFEGINHYFEEIKDFISDHSLEYSKILYVDIEGLPRGIISPVIIYILEYFKNINELEKILVFDECWEYLENHVHFVSKCFRTFRKTGAFPIAISQSLLDFKGKNDKLFTAITNNSYFNVLFPQEIEADLSLSEFDISRIDSLEFEKNVYSECYLKSKDDLIRKVMRNYLTPLELEIAHTEAGQSEMLFDFIKNYQPYFNGPKEAIEAYVRLKHDEKNKDDFAFFTSVCR